MPHKAADACALTRRGRKRNDLITSKAQHTGIGRTGFVIKTIRAQERRHARDTVTVARQQLSRSSSGAPA